MNTNLVKSLNNILDSERSKQFIQASISNNLINSNNLNNTPFKNSIAIIKNPSSASSHTIQKLISAELNNIETMKTNSNYKFAPKAKVYNENHLENKFFAKKRFSQLTRETKDTKETRETREDNEKRTNKLDNDEEWNQFNIIKSDYRRKILVKTPLRINLNKENANIVVDPTEGLFRNNSSSQMLNREKELNRSFDNLIKKDLDSQYLFV